MTSSDPMVTIDTRLIDHNIYQVITKPQSSLARSLPMGLVSSAVVQTAVFFTVLGTLKRAGVVK